MVVPVVACIHHLERPSAGLAGEVLRGAGVELDERDLRRGDPLPDLDRVAGVISFGGEQSLREIERYPYLEAELGLLRSAVERELPLLGICLGGQLLARATGGTVERLPRRMIGWPEVSPLPAAAGDPLFGALPRRQPVLHWNEDFFTVPDDADELLSRPGPGGEAIRVGPRAWGIQFHPEADQRILDSWYEGGEQRLRDAGVSEEQARAADAAREQDQRLLAAELFGAFARLVGPGAG